MPAQLPTASSAAPVADTDEPVLEQETAGPAPGSAGPGAPRRRVWWVLGLLAVAVQLVAIYQPSGPPSPSWFPNLDKVGHVLMFAAPVGGLLLATRTPDGRLGRTARWLLPGLFVAHAVVSELIQWAFYSTRDGDWRDALADGCGVVLGVLGATAWVHLARRRGRPGRRP